MNKSSNKFRHLVWPLVSLALLLLFNAIFTDNFFKIEIKKADSVKEAAQPQAVPDKLPAPAGEAAVQVETSVQTETAVQAEAAETAVQAVVTETTETVAAEQLPSGQNAPAGENKGVSIFGYYLYGTPIDILNQIGRAHV